MRYMTEEYRGFRIIYDTLNGWADVVSPDERIERRVLAEDDTIENCAHAYVDAFLGMDETDRKYEAAEANYEEDEYTDDGRYMADTRVGMERGGDSRDD